MKLNMTAEEPKCSSLPCLFRLTDQIRFTPVAITKRDTPLLGDHDPSIPFLATSKSRKLWKRFRSSCKSMSALGNRGQDIVETDLLTEINASANVRFRRGVKRLRLGVSDACLGVESVPSFLETKWEAETTRKRRKYAVMGVVASSANEDSGSLEREQKLVNNIQNSKSCRGYECEVDDLPDMNGGDIGNIRDVHNYAAIMSFFSGRIQQKTEESVGNGPVVDDLIDNYIQGRTTWDADTSEDIGSQSPVAIMSGGENTNSVTVDNKDLKTMEPALIQSALKISAFDGEDAALLSEFLSRAKAKRAANSAMVPKDTENADKEDLKSSSTSIWSRRALEELDKNSTSLQTPLMCLSKRETSPSDTTAKDENIKGVAEDRHSPAGRRRSTRSRTPNKGTNQIHVRRANPTEVVFLQQTEPHKLALTTRRNTIRNKGKAQLPKLALRTLAKRQAQEVLAPEDDDDTAVVESRNRVGGKQVSWNEERLVEYARQSPSDCVDDITDISNARRIRSIRCPSGKAPPDEQERVNISADTAPSTPDRRSRRLPPSATVDTTEPISTTPSMPDKQTVVKRPAVATHISKRKKITLKSQDAGLLKLSAKGVVSLGSKAAKREKVVTAPPVSTRVRRRK